MKQTILQGKNVSKIFVQGQEQNKVLNQVDVDIFEQDFTVIMGSSGAGKSTLLYVLSGMDEATKGSVTYRETEINHLRETQMAALRAKEFGFVFQQTHLVSNLTLFENVAVAGFVRKIGNTKKVKEQARLLLTQMGVEGAWHRLPSQVSGGEAQRAAIARAMIGSPDLLFADEPTGALNKAHSIAVLNLLTDLHQSGQSILMVTHDLRAAIRGNRILYMEDGRIVEELALTPFKEGEEQQRESEVNRWLSHLKW